MPDLSDSITAIREGAKEDRFTYLTILQYHVTTPAVLPALNEVLQDAGLTQEIGWDLVQMLVTIDGSETCLETVARLGNPREVLIKVMEALERLAGAEDDDVDDEPEEEKAVASDSKIPDRFITLLGMLAILHRRIKTKHPSRFLGPSLVKVFEAYMPIPEMTAAVVNLVRSLSGRKRPPLPQRSSSINILNADKDGDISKNAPDPEAEQEDSNEDELQRKLLQSFATCVLQRYVNAHEMQWSPRLLEIYHPEKLVPGKKTMAQAFRENEVLQQRDSVVGQLVALLSDLGLDGFSGPFIESIYEASAGIDPLAAFEDFTSPDDIHLSPGGTVSLMAYWLFSTDVFGADNPEPEMHLFPEHFTILERFLGDEAQAQVVSSPGTADAVLAIGLGLEHRKLVVATEDASFMTYHHHLTLISVFHPDLQTRNAATRFAGTILHSEPDDHNRLEILEDLLENCMFASLKACAVRWLKEELITARQEKLTNLFSKSEVIERLQYAAFPDMLSVVDMDDEALLEFWVENNPFLLQAANFGYFLFASFKDLVPSGMKGAVEQRFSEPLILAAEKLGRIEGVEGGDKMQVDILIDRLRSLNAQ
ncbi:Uu.00g061670.m01.CDS01 [Anthostomella pinea]|uniref:Uu.00g061670.m01.CDS01 n=1 Tax=Anthostomella pinea TaxID=933095 RepID=A0AAI8VSH5_9PEZI|nr:Uu.00g061670.m01.CDS01 [Anthostomella pinea]